VSSFGAAALAGARSRVSRRLGLTLSIAAHGAMLVLLAVISSRPAPAPAAQPEPLLLRLAPPPRPARPAPPAAPRRPPPRRRPVQPPPAIVPPPLAPEPEPDSAPETEAPGDTDPPAATPGSDLQSPAADAPFQLGEVARPPAVIQKVMPEYPRTARAERIDGLVVLRVVISADGAVEPGRIQVVHSVPALDGVAIAAIQRWRFSPAIAHTGQPVRVVIEVPFQFSLR
jgi:protein TonB